MATNTRKLAALLGSSGANIADAGTINTAGITNDAINADKIVANAVGTSEVDDNVLTAADLAANSVGESELSVDYTAQSVPHIIPGVLQPAIGGKLLNGADHSGAYGTPQTQSGGDGHSYYYTDIKGSKPIKDPRIGAHFGSQRHKFKSLQLLEQETATHGKEVYSIDGREWCRAVDGTGTWSVNNSDGGVSITSDATNNCTGIFLEITGYFNDFNISVNTASDNANDIDVKVNGSLSDGVEGSTTLGGDTTAGSPLGGRYVDKGSLINGGSIGTTPAINTIRYECTNGASEYIYVYAIELIAQDTTSTANRSKIQIPSQNVVSYGKKFNVSAEGSSGHHYDPFSAKTDGSAWTSPTSGNNTANSAASWPTNIDTANSLGLENWVNGSSYYRPYNGGRVVKYVDSTGTIKTAVTVMPPNARSIANAANLSGGAEKGDDSAGNTSAAAPNDNYRPTFTDQTIATAQDLHEVAKTFHWREFGNGSANGGSGGTYADASMLNSEDNIAYVMDDGLTALSAKEVFLNSTPYFYTKNPGSSEYFITFIGTGISTIKANANTEHVHVAQNLSYGTHILRFFRNSSTSDAYLDGVQLTGSHTDLSAIDGVTFHQPKMPPIPEDACVIADYMLMADFVPQTNAGIQYVSKGVRFGSASRDMFYDKTAGSQQSTPFVPDVGVSHFGDSYWIGNSSGMVGTKKLVCFGSSFSVTWRQVNNEVPESFVITAGADGTTDLTNYTRASNSAGSSGAVAANGTVTRNNGSAAGNYMTAVAGASVPLGVQTIKTTSTHSSSGKYEYVSQVGIHTPIHTSSHYQAFETPFLYELIGGDRNMEQTNLVVSPDGKTWDEVTRDTSYIGNQCISTAPASESGTPNTSANTHPKIHTRWRGTEAKTSAWRIKTWLNKDFAIAYNHVICLKNGLYRITFTQRYNTSVDSAGAVGVVLNQISWNGVADSGVASHLLWGYHNDDEDVRTLTGSFHLKRGDQISFQGPSLDRRSDIVQIDRIS